MKEQESEFLYHTSCECGSSDGKGVFSDGHTFCFVCSAWTPPTGEEQTERRSRNVESKNLDLVVESRTQELSARNISTETARKYDYSVGKYKGETVQIAPYYDKEGNLVAQKLRYKDKRFKFIGDTSDIQLFGQQLFRDGGKRIVITEGEIDAMSVSQAFNNRWPVVSIPTGAKGAEKALRAQIEWLEKFDEIVIAFDSDEEGEKAAKKCAVMFKAGMVKIANWSPHKDANDYLKNGMQSSIAPKIFEAKVYRPDGIIEGTELTVEDLMKEENIFSFNTPYPLLNNKLKGIRKGEITMFAAGSGVGKSTLVREIAAHYIKTLGLKIGYIALEESVKKTAIGLMGIDLDVPMGDLFMNRKLVTPERFTESHTRMINNGRLYLYDHFGSLESANLISKMRYMAVACGVDFIILDHITIVVSGMEGGDERRTIDNLMTHIRTLVESTGVGVIAVTHLRVPEGTPHEEGGRVTMSQLRGSGAIKQISDNIVAVERDQQGDAPDESQIRLLKNRLFGDTGLVDMLLYNHKTGRLLPIQTVEDQIAEDTF